MSKHVYLCLTMIFYLCLSIYVCLSMSIYLCLSIYAYLSMSIYLCLSFYVYLSMLSIYLCISVSLYLSMYVFGNRLPESQTTQYQTCFSQNNQRVKPRFVHMSFGQRSKSWLTSCEVPMARGRTMHEHKDSG